MAENNVHLDVFFYLVNLAFCGAMDITPVQRKCDWKTLARFSVHQQVVALVYSALLKDRCGCPDDVFAFIESHALCVMLRNDVKCEKTYQLLKDAFAEGIIFAVIKGQTIADCYADPLTRQSNDIDLLVEAAEIDKAFRFLNKRMISVERWTGNGHYAVLSDSTMGTIELHDSLFTRKQGDVWFPKCQLLYELPKFVGCRDHFELDATQHFNFICFHFLNHFVEGGISLQMCMDLEVFYRKYKDEIDIYSIKQELEKIGGMGLIKAVVGLLRTSGEEVQLPFDEADEKTVEDLVEDIIYGEGNKMVFDQDLLVRYSCRDKRMEAIHSPAYFYRFKLRNALLAIQRYLFPYPQKVKMAYLDEPFLCAYFRYVSKNIRERLARRPKEGLNEDIERREKLLKEVGLL